MEKRRHQKVMQIALRRKLFVENTGKPKLPPGMLSQNKYCSKSYNVGFHVQYTACPSARVCSELFRAPSPRSRHANGAKSTNMSLRVGNFCDLIFWSWKTLWSCPQMEWWYPWNPKTTWTSYCKMLQDVASMSVQICQEIRGHLSHYMGRDSKKPT